MKTRNKVVLVMAILVLMLLLVVSIAVFAEVQWKETEISRSVPLPPPSQINIVTPDPSLPLEIFAFSGRWEGIWEGPDREVKEVLIVEEINSKTAKVIVGYSGSFGVDRGYVRHKGEVIPSGIIQYSTPYRNFSFKMGEDLKTIYGTYKGQANPRRSSEGSITMKKVEE